MTRRRRPTAGLALALLVLPALLLVVGRPALPASAAEPVPGETMRPASAAGPVPGETMRPASAAGPVPGETMRPVGGAFALTGHGYGHGRGLSQWGAYGAATRGLTADQILEFYYPGTARADAGDPQVRVLLKRDEGTDLQVSGSALTVSERSTGRALALPAAVGAEPVSAWRVLGSGGSSSRLEGSWAGAWRGYPDGAPWTASGTVDVTSGTGRSTLVYPSGEQAAYRGTLSAVPSGGRLLTVNTLSREDYLRGVVPRESPASWPAAALQAQAVAARTYTVSVSVSGQPYDICDDTYCQVYGGSGAEVASTDAAIAATARQIRTYGGRAAFTQFSASNGGYSVAGPPGQPYLVARPDPYDGVVPNSGNSWTLTLTAAQVGSAAGTGPARSIRVLRDGLGEWGGRTTSVTVVGESGERTFSGEDFRRALGLKSTWWTAPPGPPANQADLYLAATAGTGSGSLEVHALSRQSGYSDFSVHEATAAAGIDMSRATLLFGSYYGDGARDLFIVLTSGTASGRVEVHVLSAASGYRNWVLHAATPLPAVPSGVWQWQLADLTGSGRPDLVAVLPNGGASGKVEVHALSAASGYQDWSVHEATALPASSAPWTFLIDPTGSGDLVGVLRDGTGSGRTEVHTLTRASRWQQFSRHEATPLGPTPGAAWSPSLADVDGDGVADLVMVLLAGTGSGRTEVHTLSGASRFSTWIDHIATGLGPVDPATWTAAVLR